MSGASSGRVVRSDVKDLRKRLTRSYVWMSSLLYVTFAASQSLALQAVHATLGVATNRDPYCHGT